MASRRPPQAARHLGPSSPKFPCSERVPPAPAFWAGARSRVCTGPAASAPAGPGWGAPVHPNSASPSQPGRCGSEHPHSAPQRGALGFGAALESLSRDGAQGKGLCQESCRFVQACPGPLVAPRGGLTPQKAAATLDPRPCPPFQTPRSLEKYLPCSLRETPLNPGSPLLQPNLCLLRDRYRHGTLRGSPRTFFILINLSGVFRIQPRRHAVVHTRREFLPLP